MSQYLKLFNEYVDHKDLEVLTESTSEQKYYHIKGPFVRADYENKNGRIYSNEILSNEIHRFDVERIQQNTAVGELEHANSPMINFNNVSHKIESLVMVGNDGIGDAKIIPAGKGLIAEGLVKAGVKMGVSSRAIGTLKGKHVQNDLKLITVDLVSDPSASTFVDGVLEGVEWEMIGENAFKQVAMVKEQVVGLTYRERAILVTEFLKEIRKEL